MFQINKHLYTFQGLRSTRREILGNPSGNKIMDFLFQFISTMLEQLDYFNRILHCKCKNEKTRVIKVHQHR